MGLGGIIYETEGDSPFVAILNHMSLIIIIIIAVVIIVGSAIAVYFTSK